MTLELASRQFLTYMTIRKGCPTTTIQTYSLIVGAFVEYTGKNKQTNKLTLQHIDDYADYLATKCYKPKTFRNKLSIIRSFVNYLWIKDLISVRPEQVVIPRMRETHEEANFLTKKEVEQLLGVCTNVRDKAMLYTLIYTMVRVSEFTDLRLEDLHERSLIVRSGKGGKRRVVFITKQAEKAIREYLKVRGKKNGYLFPHTTGNQIVQKIHVGTPLSRSLVCRKVSFYAQLAGIEKRVSTHTLRHTGATLLLNGGARIEDTQKILGHSNIRTTLIYLHFTAPELKNSYDRAFG